MYILETERLRLRELTLLDVDHLLTIFADPVAMEYYLSTKDRPQAVRWIEWNIESYQTNGFGLWLVERKNDGQFVGQCGITLQKIPGSVEPEVGYLLRREFWGQGYATEAAIACRDWGFRHLNVSRLISIINVLNHPSIRVAARTGMAHAGEFVKPNGLPHKIYAVTRDVWLTL